MTIPQRPYVQRLQAALAFVPSIRRQLISDAFSLEERSGRAGKIYPRCNQGPGKAASAHKSAAGQSLPIHSAPVPTNVRYASNSDHSRHESELKRCEGMSPNLREVPNAVIPYRRGVHILG